jgi:hypothetical protein
MIFEKENGRYLEETWIDCASGQYATKSHHLVLNRYLTASHKKTYHSKMIQILRNIKPIGLKNIYHPLNLQTFQSAFNREHPRALAGGRC